VDHHPRWHLEIGPMIVFNLLPDGGFVAGDTRTRFTAYAYPTSENARTAKMLPVTTATTMMEIENNRPGDRAARKAFDDRNWLRLEEPS
jgi:hypothetical protein